MNEESVHPNGTGNSNTEAPADEQVSRKSQWLQIAKSTRQESSDKVKNTTPVSKLNAQWKSMRDTAYAFHQLRKFTESLLKAGDNVGELYSTNAETVVDILSSINSDDILIRYEKVLSDIFEAVAAFVADKSPSQPTSETLNEEQELFKELKAAKLAGDKKKIGQLLEKLVK